MQRRGRIAYQHRLQAVTLQKFGDAGEYRASVHSFAQGSTLTGGVARFCGQNSLGHRELQVFNALAGGA